jgi:hypothetical protein
MEAPEVEEVRAGKSGGGDRDTESEAQMGKELLSEKTERASARTEEQRRWELELSGDLAS